MSIATDKARLEQAKTDIAQAITDKGVTVPAGTKIDGMAALIGTITGGGGGIQLPDFTYTGDYYIVNDSGEEWVEGNWKAYLLTSGTFTPNVDMALDVFCVGGGASGGGGSRGGGGGGGYTTTQKAVLVAATEPVSVVVGSGGPRCTNSTKYCQAGGASSFGVVAADGARATAQENIGGDGGSGGGGSSSMSAQAGGDGGVNGADGNTPVSGAAGGKGQGTATTEFGEENAIVYSGGGAGACSAQAGTGGVGGAGGSESLTTGGGIGGSDPVRGGESAPKDTTTLTYIKCCGGGGGGYGGGGGGNGYFTGGSSGAGCQGIVVIRNARALVEE